MVKSENRSLSAAKLRTLIHLCDIRFGEESVQKMVQWVCDHVTDPQSSIVDLGCGNGHLLLELAAEGYKNLHGIDYSEAAITLAKSVAQQREYGFIKYDTVDLLAGTWDAQFDVILDKGTFDAISLNPELPDARQKYVSAVRKIIKPQGLVLITSCNWTQDELVKLFGSGKADMNEFSCTCLNQRKSIIRVRISLACQIPHVLVWWT